MTTIIITTQCRKKENTFLLKMLVFKFVLLDQCKRHKHFKHFKFKADWFFLIFLLFFRY